MIAGSFRLKRAICGIEWMSTSLRAATNKPGNYKQGQQIQPAPVQLPDRTTFWYSNIIILIGRWQPVLLLHFNGTVNDLPVHSMLAPTHPRT